MGGKTYDQFNSLQKARKIKENKEQKKEVEDKKQVAYATYFLSGVINQTKLEVNNFLCFIDNNCGL